MLFKLAEEFCRDDGDFDSGFELVKAFVERVRSLDVDSAEEGEAVEDNDDRDAITVSTIHQAKGLEWEHVIVVRMNRGVCPVNFRYESDPLEKKDENTAEQNKDEVEAIKRKLALDHMAEEVSRLIFGSNFIARDVYSTLR
jgi:superfamily I DNA/RNA helicase